MHTVSPKEKSEARNANTKWTRFCETILREAGFAKPRLKIFEIRRVSGFCPAGGCGRNAGRGFGILAEGKELQNYDFDIPEYGYEEVGTDTLAKEFIQKTLQEIYPNQKFYEKIDFIHS